MRGHELLLEHFAKIYNEGGRYDFGDGRIAFLPAETLRAMREFAAHEVGAGGAARGLTRVGVATGDGFSEIAVEMVEEALEQRRSLASVVRLLGIVESALPKRMGEDGTGEYELHWYGALEQAGVRPGDVVARCYFTTAFASGYLSGLGDEDIYFVEHQCVSQGAEHCIALGKTADDWGEDWADVARLYGEGVAQFDRTLSDIERAHILRVVAATDTREEAAEILGIGVATLYRRLKKYGVT